MLNQNVINNEVEVDRLKVTSASQSHPYLTGFTNPGCFPPPVTKTGTFSTNSAATPKGGKTVLGVGTLFLSELAPGDFLYNAGHLRKIRYIFSDTMLELEYAFPANLSGVAVASPLRKNYKMITAKSTGTADAILNEVNFAQGQSIVTGGTPLSFDVTTANSAIEFTASR